MALDDFDERRRQHALKREREREEEDAQGSLADKRRGLTPNAINENASSSEGKILEFFERADPLMEQLNNLYSQYIAGVERMPPIERRKQLDQMMATLQLMAKPTQALQFRYNTVHAKYVSHRDRWDRLCRDLESGKIKRTVGPKRD